MGQPQLATVARTTGEPTTECLASDVTVWSASQASAAVARRFQSTSATRSVCICNFGTWKAHARLEPSLTMAKFESAHEKRGSHDGLYAARLYWHDPRPLLRHLRQSCGRSPIRSSRITGFGEVT
jgi:hypothetical protein